MAELNPDALEAAEAQLRKFQKDPESVDPSWQASCKETTVLRPVFPLGVCLIRRGDLFERPFRDRVAASGSIDEACVEMCCRVHFQA